MTSESNSPQDDYRPFNPLDYANLTKNVVEELMRQAATSLPVAQPFRGGGVYALFYTGDDEDYAPFRSVQAKAPIYVGKAVPSGGRKGGTSGFVVKKELYDRLKQHAGSIDAVENLALGDFLCRYLVVEPLWIVMAERFLITRFQPLWNLVLDGFGNHNPGKGRHEGQNTLWDVYHPGRPWAKSLKQTRDRETIRKIIQEFADARIGNPGMVDELAEKAAEAEAAESDDELDDAES